jgi:hypothetical protein
MVNGQSNKPRSEAVLSSIRNDVLVLLERSQAPDEVRGFLLQRWTRLLAEISVSRGEAHSDWAAGWDTVHALLWSLAPKQGPEDALRLLQLLPLLVERLQDGCEALQMDAVERDGFFANLAMLHAAIVRGGLHPGAVPPPFAEHLDAPGSAPMSAYTSTPPEPSPRALDDSASSDVDGIISALQPGSRLCFIDDSDSETELILQWVSPMRGMFLFTDAKGYEAVSLTRAKLKEKWQRQEARLPAA